jgi:isopentenyl-diphosphate delta-isomerase
MVSEQPHITSRKEDHILLCAEGEVESRQKTTLLEEVELLHDALPEVAVEGVGLETQVFGKRLKAPLLITGMTGGAPRAAVINRELAEVAEALGVAFGVGSQRAMLKHPELGQTYRVRDVAPGVLLFGNIGAVQAAQMTSAQLEDLVGAIGADALCIHLNPGQELIQPEGDRDFRGCLDAIAQHNDTLKIPLILKETGCGLSPRTLDKIKASGVKWVDVSGAGGTTWIGVEALRTPPDRRTMGELLWDWGVPTAASILYARRRGLNTIASGGLRNALDAAKALSLGATLAGMALPWLRAHHEAGAAGALKYGEGLIYTLRAICTLTGAKSAAELSLLPKIIGPRLERWSTQDPHFYTQKTLI